MRRLKVIGLMSGTSFDGIDVAMLDTDGQEVYTIYTSYIFNYDKDTKNKIGHLIKSGVGSLEEIASLSNSLTQEHAKAVLEFVSKYNVDLKELDLVAFHGQTIFHKPESGITWQLGNPALLAELLQKTVVADFRSADVAVGGQGAPLVPIYHQAILCDAPNKPVAVVNIGGVSNITWVGKNDILAFDVGPGNALINDEIYETFGLPFDDDGKVAAKGRPNYDIIAGMLQDDFFKQTPPKSLDRNYFKQYGLGELSIEDRLATLTIFTVQSILAAISYLPQVPLVWLVAGGGRHNSFLVSELVKQLPGDVAKVEDVLGIDGDGLEAQAFAFLAARVYNKLSNSFPTTTGCKRPIVGGAIYNFV